MPYNINYKRLYTFAATVSWILLVGNSLFVNQASNPGIFQEYSVFLGRLFKVSFIAFVFLTQRASVEAYKGTDFIGYLWKLFIRAGSTAYICGLFILGITSLDFFTNPKFRLLEILYFISFAFVTYFLGKAFYIWRNMILFQKTRALQYEWDWFELLIYSSLLGSLLPLELLKHIPLIGLMVLYMLFLSIHLRWVAYLTATKKWRSMFRC